MPKQARFIDPKCHRPVNWNEAAVQRTLQGAGYLYLQPKKDGIRIHAFRDGGDVIRVVTREGIEIRSLEVVKESLRALLRALPFGFVVDGEVTVPGVPFEAGSGRLRAYRPIQRPVQFWVWDALPLSALLGDTEHPFPYKDRLNLLASRAKRAADEYGSTVQVVPTHGCDTIEAMHSVYAQYREAGEEGAVVKDPLLGVRNGKVTGQWKLKPSDTCDGVIRGVLWGTPGLGNAGKIIGFTVELESGVLVDVTGLTQTQMQEFTNNVVLASYLGVHPYIGRYCEVAYMELTASGSLRHPSFVQFRDLTYAQGIKS